MSRSAATRPSRRPGDRLGAAVTAAVIVGTVLSASLAAAATKPSAWIDQPLPGAVLPFGPTAVTIHAAADGGIAKVRLLVDGLPATELPGAPGDLIVVTWSWQPVSLGSHLLTAIGVATDGTPSVPTSASVTFVSGGGGGPTPTPTPTATVAPTASPRPRPSPTPAPCTPPTPDSLLPSDNTQFSIFSDPNPPTFSWGYRSTPSCRPSGFRVTVVDSPSSGWKTSSGKLAASATAWTPGVTFPAPLAVCTYYKWTFEVLRSNGTTGHATTRTLSYCG